MGVSASGGDAPIVIAREMRAIGKSPLPSTAPRVTFNQMLNGAEDGQSGEVEGVVNSVQSWKNIPADMALSDGNIMATTVKEAGVHYESLIDAKVRLRGNQAPCSITVGR